MTNTLLRSPDSLNPVIGIIGGKGKFGQWLDRFFTQQGLKVLISDISETQNTSTESLSYATLCKKSDILVLAVPCNVMSEVLTSIHPLLRKEQLVVDIASVKSDISNILNNLPTQVVSIHPMFAPSVIELNGQTVVFTKVSTGTLADYFVNILKNAGARLVESSLDEHDRIMAIVQGLTHFTSVVFGHVLQQLKISPENTRCFTSPVYRIQMDIMLRILQQSPDLYGQIATTNPYVPEVLASFLTSASDLAKVITNKDVPAYKQIFNEAALHMASISKEVVEESNALIEHVRISG
jgi:prephenate dehydrogenase